MLDINALPRAILISTASQITSPTMKHRRGVNALPRAILISTKTTLIARARIAVCQCPTTGYPHFYPASLEPAI